MDNSVITVEGNFHRYIFQSDKNAFFIASIMLKPYAYKNIVEFIKNSIQLSQHIPLNSEIKDFIEPNVVLQGNSESFKKEIEDKVAEYSITAKIIWNEKYQRFQLELITFFEKIPTTEQSMIKFLQKRIDTIGLTTAKKIVSHFGIGNVEQVFNYEPERLLEIQGIKESQLEKIKASWNKHQNIFEILNYLKDFEVNDNIGLKIFNKYESKSLEIIQTNPYELCTIDGLSFLTIDKIARKNGVKKNDSKRIVFGIRFAFHDYVYNSGNTVMHIDDLLNQSVKLLDVPPKEVLGYINKLIEKEKILRSPYPIQSSKKVKKFGVKESKETKSEIETDYILDESYLALPKILNLEKSIFNLVLDLINTPFHKQVFTPQIIEEFKSKNIYGLDEYQMQAAINVFKNKISVLTGGPGTGKTKSIEAIVKTMEQQGMIVKLLAPTGKAAQRILQSTGRPAETLHRYLKLLSEESIFDNKIESENEFLDIDFLIIDESSMLDLYVIYQCLKRINPVRTSILFVGDKNQLPPVGLGYYFRDIIQSNLITVSTLIKSHRISENSSVFKNAANIIQNKQMDLESSSDFEYIEESNPDKIEEHIVEIYKNLIQEGVSPLDIQVLSPVKEGKLGCKELNKVLRPIANPNFTGNERLSYIVGDKVMQIENNYDLMVFNGDTGIVSNYDIAKDVTIVEFGDPNFRVEEKDYTKENLNELDLAYCITVHKSQGSDYKYVIMPIYQKHYYQLTKQSVYTGMTRTKEKLFLIGDKRTIKTVGDQNKNIEVKTNLHMLFKTMDKSHILNEADIFNDD